jgi:tetratricopeptide (TPR) repeat protein
MMMAFHEPTTQKKECLSCGFSCLEEDATLLDGITDEEAEADHTKSNALLEIGRFIDALQAYDQALLIKPNRSSTHFKRGNALIQLEMMDEAVQAFERSLDCSSDDAYEYQGKGIIERLGFFRECTSS